MNIRKLQTEIRIYFLALKAKLTRLLVHGFIIHLLYVKIKTTTTEATASPTFMQRYNKYYN